MVAEIQIPRFDPEKHEYEGGTLPSVTQVLWVVGIIDTTWYTDESRDRGKAVHLACQYLDEGDLDEESIDPAIKGRINAYKKFKRELAIEPEWIEVPLSNSLYAGTPDRIMTSRPKTIWDIKGGAFQDWHRLQLAAYTNLLPDPFSYSRCALYLRNDGTYTIREFPKTEYQTDINVFLAALSIFNWRKRHGK